jgi:hypothetical protein
MNDLISQKKKISLEQVFKNVRSEISDMGIVINRRAARIKPDMPLSDRRKKLYLTT